MGDLIALDQCTSNANGISHYNEIDMGLSEVDNVINKPGRFSMIRNKFFQTIIIGQ